MTTSQKDFLALSHGQEWVTFYESFDKLVQDNLSRSSDLLRRAMALPEVADREVQQIRSEMEEKLASERGRQRAVLTALQEDLAGSYRQVSMLARSVSTVIGDLERLAQRVDESIAEFDADGTHPQAVAEVVAPVAPNGVAQPNGMAPADAAYATPGQPGASMNQVFDAPEAVVAEPDRPVAPVDEPELPQLDARPADFNVDDMTAAVEEQEAMLEAAEQQLDNLESAIDLSALVEAEAETAPVTAAGPVDAGASVTGDASSGVVSGDQRPRPHWLSVTRSGS